MSIDTAIAAVFAALEAGTAATNALVAATDKNTAILERVVAGQEAALAKLDGKAGAATSEPKPRGRPAKETPTVTADQANAPASTTETAPPAAAAAAKPFMLTTAANNSTADNSKGQPEPTADWRAGDFSEAQVKGEFIGWLGSTTDAAVRKGYSDFVVAVAQQFGLTKPFGPEGMKTDEQRQQALFYLRRKRAGLPVDFNAEYDFAGDPAQGTPTATGEGDPMDDLG